MGTSVKIHVISLGYQTTFRPKKWLEITRSQQYWQAWNTFTPHKQNSLTKKTEAFPKNVKGIVLSDFSILFIYEEERKANSWE